MSSRRFYRYDFASIQVLLDLASSYDGIAISAHILSYTPTSVIQLLNATEKPFFIDPMTFAFARDLDNISRNGKIRRSYGKLIQDYGPPFSDCVTGDRLIAAQFRNSRGEFNNPLIVDMCRRVLAFQQSKCKFPTSFTKYAKLLRKGITLKPELPSFLVAPYFFARGRTDDWYAISLRCAQVARTLKGSLELYPVICIAKDVLWDEAQISGIVQDYAGFDGYFIWVDDLDEKGISLDELGGLKALVSGLTNCGGPVYSLYGGYLCDLLGRFGLSGYCSGICYGESRSVDARGGGAGNRYYVPDAHLKVSDGVAYDFYAESDRNKNLMCSCPTCSAIRKTLPMSLGSGEYVDQFFAQMDFLNFRRHFVNLKSQEMRSLSSMDNAQVLASLETDMQTMDNIDRIRRHPPELTTRHLRIWRTLFSRQ